MSQVCDRHPIQRKRKLETTMIPREKTSTVTFFLIPVGIKGSGTITGWFKGLPRP